MDSFIGSFQTLATQTVAGIQKIGLAAIPLVVAIAAIVNYFGGERAIRAVGVAVATVAVLAIILANALAFQTWIGSIPSATAATATAVPNAR